MNVRRLLSLLLGIWLGASLLLIFVATENFRVANRAVTKPPDALAGYIKTAGAEPVRQILRYQASEANRTLFDVWGVAQFATALIIFLMVLFGTSSGRFPVFLALAITVLVGIMHWLVTPQISAASRLLDFVPVHELNSERARLQSIHNIYSTMEVVKLLLVAGLASYFLVSGQRRGRSELR